MNAEATEAEVLRGLIPELEAEGYDVLFARVRLWLQPFLAVFDLTRLRSGLTKSWWSKLFRDPVATRNSNSSAVC